MRLVLQRVQSARITSGDSVIGEIERGLLSYVGMSEGDDRSDLDYLVDRTVHLRIFENEEGKMDRSLLDIDGAVLAVSQFTLCADVHRGRRPSFDGAMAAKRAEKFYTEYIRALQETDVRRVESGAFGTKMEVESINDGPVTMIVDSDRDL